MSEQDHDGSPTLSSETSSKPTPGSLALLIISGGFSARVPLAGPRPLTIGRSHDADIRLDDPQAGRRHARMYIGLGLEIEDLKSLNGTFLEGVRLAPGERTAFSRGQVLRIGTTMLVLEGEGEKSGSRRPISLAYFEYLLREECAREPASGVGFAVLRVRVEGAAASGALREAITAELAPADVVADYAPGEYALLLPRATSERARQQAGKLRRRLGTGSGVVALGCAHWPEDGRTAEALIGRANDDLRGVGTEGSRPIVAKSAVMRALSKRAAKYAESNLNILIQGETGVGKDVLAHFIHEQSSRRGKAFIVQNCAAIPESLDSELFGHEKGAFTGAVAARPGLFEVADGGTVFLDEIGDMALATQAKLLRVLEQRVVVRLGSTKPRKVDIRILSATNVDLQAAVTAGRFRQDLLFRIRGCALTIPPLRARPDDIPELAREFLERAAHESGLHSTPRLTDDAVRWLMSQPWPGNVRELRNAVERALLFPDGDVLSRESFDRRDMTEDAWSESPVGGAGPMGFEDGADLGDDDADEKSRVEEALRACAGNQTRAAKLLKVSRRHFVKLLDRHQVPRPRK